MFQLVRFGLIVGLAALAATPAQAQFPFGEGFWGSQPPRAAARSQARPQAKSQQRQQPQQQSLFSFGNDDDDDDDRPQAQQPRSQGPRAGGRGASLSDGGARPAIAAVSPSVVAFSGGQAAGTVVIDTRGRSLYYVLGSGRAYRYPIAVGREGFSWTGTQRVSRVASWPDWLPPAEMRQRQPGLPVVMTGGLRNPLGAKAIYLGSTLYRIHGTNDVRSIGTAPSSGCFRMSNGHVTHLATLAGVGTTVQVMRGLPGAARRNFASPAGASAGGRS